MDLFIVYVICFGAGLLFAVISAVMGDVFGGGDAHVEAGHAGGDGHAGGGFASGDMPGFAPLSPTMIATWVTAFGAAGMILGKIPATRSPWVSAPVAALAAFGVAGVVFVLFRAVFRRTQGSSEGRVAAVVGLEANIITPIPENGVGEIAYVQAGTRYTAPARSETGRPVAGGATVRISRVVANQFFVTPA